VRMRELAQRARALVRRAHARSIAVLALLLAAPLHADIVSDLENAIIGFFSSIWNGIEGFFGTIFDAIANTFATIFNAPAQAIEASWTDLENSTAGLGIFSPIVTILVVFAVVAVATFLIWLVIKISVSEGEQTGEEAEEGV
jgi:hypothetical protein